MLSSVSMEKTQSFLAVAELDADLRGPAGSHLGRGPRDRVPRAAHDDLVEAGQRSKHRIDRLLGIRRNDDSADRHCAG